ncbi:hypothetical protein [Sulfurimonas sp. HSL-1716]|uniref:hypothetical protein n=1 Tax=Hydrocurvibacter sulfurireducens TaxID=3131937 RepID=UPI0031F8D481
MSSIEQIDLPETKEILNFDPHFLIKVKEGSKGATIRNNPVSLGYKKIDDDIVVEVISCEKTFFVIEKGEMYARNPKDSTFRIITNYKDLGFDSQRDAIRFYKSYFHLKREFAYIVVFERVGKDLLCE